MKKFKIITTHKKLLADTTTPVSIYLRLRDVFPNALLLESSDYHSRENSTSYICCEPIAGLLLDKGQLKLKRPGGAEENFAPGQFELIGKINDFIAAFETDESPSKVISNGLFGYFAHE